MHESASFFREERNDTRETAGEFTILFKSRRSAEKGKGEEGIGYTGGRREEPGNGSGASGGFTFLKKEGVQGQETEKSNTFHRAGECAE